MKLIDEDVDEDDREAYEDQSNRLELADKLTRVMTQDEYIYYSECRQASFTYKKLKKFREWTEMSKFYDSKANSDIIDSLGFLCYEAVSKITETSLMVKRKEDDRIALNPTVKHGKIFKGLFEKPISNQRPIQPRHVMEAYRLLQAQSHPLQLFQRTISRNALSIF